MKANICFLFLDACFFVFFFVLAEWCTWQYACQTASSTSSCRRSCRSVTSRTACRATLPTLWRTPSSLTPHPIGGSLRLRRRIPSKSQFWLFLMSPWRGMRNLNYLYMEITFYLCVIPSSWHEKVPTHPIKPQLVVCTLPCLYRLIKQDITCSLLNFRAAARWILLPLDRARLAVHPICQITSCWL